MMSFQTSDWAKSETPRVNSQKLSIYLVPRNNIHFVPPSRVVYHCITDNGVFIPDGGIPTVRGEICRCLMVKSVVQILPIPDSWFYDHIYIYICVYRNQSNEPDQN